MGFPREGRIDRKQRCEGSRSKKSKMKISQHLVQFVSDSSIRSLRRTVVSEGAFKRGFWTVFLLLCFVGMSCHLALVSMSFANGDLAVDLQFSAAANQPFPSVSYCDRARFGPGAVRGWVSGRFLTPANFSANVRDRVRQLYRREPEAKGLLLLIESYNNYLSTVISTLIRENRSLHEISDLGFKGGASIVRTVLVTGRVTWLTASDLQVVPFHHPEYINCYTISLPADVSQLVSAMTLALPAASVAANSTGWAERECLTAGFPIDSIGTVSGFVFDLHSELDVPFARSQLLLPVGGYNRVQFTQCSLRRLLCSGRTGWSTEFRDSSSGAINRRQFGYTKEMCIMRRIHGEVTRRCNCTLDIQLLNLTDRTMRCNSFATDDTIENYQQRSDCVDSVLNGAQTYQQDCENQCQELWFPATVSGAGYSPMNELQRCLLERLLYMVNQENATVTDIETELLSNITREEAMVKFCATASRIPAFLVEFSRNAFLQQNFRQFHITTLPAFMCQIGSICGVWAGFSIAVLAEIADLLYTIVRDRRGGVITVRPAVACK